MKRFLLLVFLLLASPVFAHDCCCGGMDRLSAETVQRMKRAQSDADFNEARHQFKEWSSLLAVTDIYSPWYSVYKENYQFWSDRLEQMQEKAIDDATWKMIDAEMDDAIDAAYRRAR